MLYADADTLICLRRCLFDTPCCFVARLRRHDAVYAIFRHAIYALLMPLRYYDAADAATSMMLMPFAAPPDTTCL